MAHVVVSRRAAQRGGGGSLSRDGVTLLALGRAEGLGVVAVGNSNGDVAGTRESARICCTESDLLWVKDAVVELDIRITVTDETAASVCVRTHQTARENTAIDISTGVYPNDSHHATV